MINVIANMIDEYIYNKKTLDDDFVYTVLNIVLTEKNVIELSKNNKVYQFNSPFLGTGFAMDYSYPNGINVYVANCEKEIIESIGIYIPMLKKNINYSSDLVLVKTLEYYYFIKIIMMLMHEVEHVVQNSKYGSLNNFEDLLTTLNLRLLHNCMNNKDNYNDNIKKLKVYKFTNKNINIIEPIERFANIKSTDIIRQLIYNFTTLDEVKNILLYLLDLDVKFHYIYSYVSLNNNSPLNKYIKYLESLNEYYINQYDSSKLDNIIEEHGKEFNLEERLYYGYSITDKEFENVKLGKIKLKY